MKKILLLLAVVMTACTKVGDYASVTMDYSLGNALTRVTASEVASGVSAIVGGLPVEFYCYYGGRSVGKVASGGTITLPAGDIHIMMEYYPQNQTVIGGLLFGSEPSFSADTTVTFHSYTKDVLIKAHYDCAMVVCDKSAVSEVVSDKAIPTADFGDFFGFFVSGESDDPATLKVISVARTDYKDRTFDLKWSDLEKGKFYTLSPTGITEGSGAIGFDIPDFGGGGAL
jgi:hypothetical protein